MNTCDGNHGNKERCTDTKCWDDVNRHFNIWWWNEGSGIAPKNGQEAVFHAEHLARTAWANGEFKAREDIVPLINSIGAIMSYLLLQENIFKEEMINGKITNEMLKTWGVRAEVTKGGHIQLLI